MLGKFMVVQQLHDADKHSQRLEHHGYEANEERKAETVGPVIDCVVAVNRVHVDVVENAESSDDNGSATEDKVLVVQTEQQNCEDKYVVGEAVARREIGRHGQHHVNVHKKLRHERVEAKLLAERHQCQTG